MDSSEREAQFLDSSFNGLHLDQSSEYDYFRNSAVHRFPVEILVQIFLDILAEPGLPITSTPFDCSQLWRLGHICARWRSIVCSDIPLVWSNIKVNFRSSIRVAQLAPHSVEILQVCLHRTQDCPLTITFACATHTGSPHQDDWLRCLELLVGVSDRWKSIDFYVPITVLSRFAPVKGRLPLLETLKLSLDPPNTHSLPHAVVAFEDAPRLTSVATSSHLSMDSFRLPWNQLTSYRTQRTDVGDCVEVLQLSPYLRSLYVRLDAIKKVLPSLGQSDPLPSMPKSHNFLTSLSVNGLMRPGSEHVLLQRLLKLQFNISEAFFPSLTELRLVTSPGSLVNFVTPPSPTSCFGSALTKLTIRGVFDAEADYVGAKEFLSSLPSIRELVFGVCFHRDQKVSWCSTLITVEVRSPSSRVGLQTP
jgi:hypothetical protein